MDYDRVLKILTSNSDRNILDRLRSVGLNPATDMAGGDWRDCDFSGQDLSGFDLRNCDFGGAKFVRSGVEGADFRGAILPRSIMSAIGLGRAILDDKQFAQTEKWDEESLPASKETAKLIRMIKDARSYGEARALVTEMNEKSLGPSPVAYAMLLQKLAGRDVSATALSDYEEFVRLGGRPDTILVNQVISKTQAYSDSLNTFGDFEKYGLLPDDRTFNILINRSENSSQAYRWIREKRNAGFRPDRYEYQFLMRKFESFDQRLNLLQKMELEGIVAEKLDYETALESAETNEQIEIAIGAMLDANINPDDKTYNRAINRSREIDYKYAWFDKMRDSGFHPDGSTFKAFVHDRSSIFDVLCISVEFLQNNVELNGDMMIGTITEAIRRAGGGKREIDTIFAQGHTLLNEGGTIEDLLRWLATHEFLTPEESDMVLTKLRGSG